MVEVLGMEVNVELIAKNVDKFKRQVENQVKQIPAGIQQSAQGMTSGLGGMGALGKLTAIAGSALVIAEGVKRIVQFLSRSSPMLKGIFDIFHRAMMTFFRPFGDFLATLLKPLAVLLMRFAVKFLQASRQNPGMVGIGGPGLIGPGSSVDLIEMDWGAIWEEFKTQFIEGWGDFNWLNVFLEGTATSSLGGLGDFLLATLNNIFNTEFESFTGFGSWFIESLKTAFIDTFNAIKGFGQWLFDSVKGFLFEKFGIGSGKRSGGGTTGGGATSAGMSVGPNMSIGPNQSTPGGAVYVPPPIIVNNNMNVAPNMSMDPASQSAAQKAARIISEALRRRSIG